MAGTAMQDPELALVVACCTPRTTPDRLAVIRHAASRAFDPALLLARAGAHRVEGFVDEALRAARVTLPRGIADQLRARATEVAVAAVRNAGEELRVVAALTGAGVDVLSLKGSTLAMLAHGTLILKASSDIDLVIAPQDIGSARAVLTALDYHLVLPGGAPDERRIRRFLARSKESPWCNRERGTQIDLHTRAITMRGVELGMNAPRAHVALARRGEVATLAPGPLYTYLVSHGGSHGWVRLKWIADLAALLDRSPELIATWHWESCAMGARHCSAAALLLCERLFGMAIPAALRGEITADRQAQRLATVSIRLQRGLPLSGEMIGSAGMILDMVRASALRVPGLARWPHAIWLQLNTPYTRAQLGVPAAVLPFFTLIWAPYRLLTRPWRVYRRGKLASTP